MRRRFGVGIALPAMILASTACAADRSAGRPSAAAPTASTPAASASAAALSAADTAICKEVGAASRDMVMSILPGTFGQGETTIVGAFTEYVELLRAKAADAGDDKVRAALDRLAVAAERYATTMAEADGTAFGKASEELGRACGDPPKPPLAAGDRIGPAGSPCELPVSFQVAKEWRAGSIEVEQGDPFAELTRKGSLALVCEIKARLAGHVAFIRVWSGPAAGGGLRRALETYLEGEDVREQDWSEPTLGGTPGAEVVYRVYSELLGEIRTERAFAVRTPRGVVVVSLNGIESEEAAVVSAYELAKRTLAVTT